MTAEHPLVQGGIVRSIPDLHYGDEIVWHPGRMSGDATIGHSRLTADTLAGFVWAGDSVESTAENYEVPPRAVELSCWWVALHHPAPCAWQRDARKAWLTWAQAWGNYAWHSTPSDTYPHPGPPVARPDRRKR